ncbi:hypothetical protein KQX54_009788 [Cotesia glomerata]|uniref:Uncharacterized protein n=1 Tax=Cotesia glomerata TaxID=32391 RepID=A0AAV7J2P4_COTGL|nr:hypothetical protein KQX54_009788 [Cotesia glomerata]
MSIDKNCDVECSVVGNTYPAQLGISQSLILILVSSIAQQLLLLWIESRAPASSSRASSGLLLLYSVAEFVPVSCRFIHYTYPNISSCS